jgi:hypothetical protein
MSLDTLQTRVSFELTREQDVEGVFVLGVRNKITMMLIKANPVEWLG